MGVAIFSRSSRYLHDLFFDTEPATNPKEYLYKLAKELDRASANHYDAARSCNVILAIFGWGSIILPALITSAFFKQGHNQIMGTLGLFSAIFAAVYKSKRVEVEANAKAFREAGSGYRCLFDQAKQLCAAEPIPEPTDELIKNLIKVKCVITDGVPSLPFLIYYTPKLARVMCVYMLVGLLLWGMYYFRHELWVFFVSTPAASAGPTP
jgi:hypothetical protein